MTNKIKIMIADDHKLIMQTIVRSFAADKNLMVIGQAENGIELLDLLKRNIPDIILLDISMPLMDGFEVLEYLKFHYPEIKVIVISMHFDSLIIKDLISRGTRGFLPKNADFESLVSAVYEVMATGYYFSRKVNTNIVQELLRENAINPKFANNKLNEKESQVLDLICNDRMTKEIAGIMGVSERTVERHKTSLYEKTRAKTSAGLVLYAINNNLFQPKKKY